MRLSWVVIVLGLSTACLSLSTEVPPRFTETVGLTEPWLSMKVPIADGKVTVSDAETLSVHHTTGNTDTLGVGYSEALTAAGWTKGRDTSAGGVVNQSWTKDGKSLALSVLDEGGEVVVSLSILPF